MALTLTKSDYCNAVQCPKMLWLKKFSNAPLNESLRTESVLGTGIEVGNAAKELFGKCQEITLNKYDTMASQTESMLGSGTPVLAEASFLYKGFAVDLFCRVDILKNQGDKKVEIYEVKSSSAKLKKDKVVIDDIYKHDIGFQYYILTLCGYTVERASIILVNNNYTRTGALDLHELFKIVDVTEETMNSQILVDENIANFSNDLQQSTEPFCEIDKHCFKPYPCSYFDYCTQDIAKPMVFDLARITYDKKLKFYKNNIKTFSDLHNIHQLLNTGNYPKGLPVLKDEEYLQIKHELSGCAPHIETEAIKDFLGNLSYPLYFLDFESYQSAIPSFDNSKPFEQIVFQYSLHYIEEKDGELKHKECLAYPGKDPRREVAEQLCKDIPEGVCVLAYNMTFEKTVIKRLAELYLDLASHLSNIENNIQDLMIPFISKHYYVKAMQGSYSIKYVLPALFPNEPSLDYHNLEGVHNGSEASETFKKMADMSPEELEASRQHLLKYCGLDTFAMVKIWEKLHEVTNLPLKKTW